MRPYIFSLVFALYGCAPSNPLYQTPGLYFGSPHFVPEGDSRKGLIGGVGYGAPNSAQLKITYRGNKNIIAGITYNGNFAAYSEYDDNGIFYRFNTNSADFYSGYSRHRGRKRAGWFVTTGFGVGSNTSIVQESSNSWEFIYKTNFNRFTITPGVDINITAHSKVTFSWRQSFIQFKQYQLPDTTYFHQQQFLSDMMLRFSIFWKRTGLNMFMGSYLNGRGPGDRQYDILHAEQLRIEHFFVGFGVTYQFAKFK